MGRVGGARVVGAWSRLRIEVGVDPNQNYQSSVEHRIECVIYSIYLKVFFFNLIISLADRPRAANRL